MKKFIYLALLLGFSNAYSVEEIEIANNPLAGLLEKPTEMDANKQESKAPIYPPNLYLALSVEFPTAGAAYTNSDSFTAKDLGTEYLGYFDNNKCYKYDFTEHAFIPSSRAIELSSFCISISYPF